MVELSDSRSVEREEMRFLESRKATDGPDERREGEVGGGL